MGQPCVYAVRVCAAQDGEGVVRLIGGCPAFACVRLDGCQRMGTFAIWAGRPAAAARVLTYTPVQCIKARGVHAVERHQAIRVREPPSSPRARTSIASKMRTCCVGSASRSNSMCGLMR